MNVDFRSMDYIPVYSHHRQGQNKNRKFLETLDLGLNKRPGRQERNRDDYGDLRTGRDYETKLKRRREWDGGGDFKTESSRSNLFITKEYL